MSDLGDKRRLLLRLQAWAYAEPGRVGWFYVGGVLLLIAVILWIAFGT